MKRLLAIQQPTNEALLWDALYLAAINIEDAMLKGGAKPGKDYTVVDLYRLGTPIALELWMQIPDHKAVYADGYGGNNAHPD